MAKEEQSRRGFIKAAGLMAGGVLGSSIISPSGVAESVQMSSSMSKGAQFRALIAKPDPLVMPVVPDVYLARLSELEGFQAVFVGGSWAAGSGHGVPDFGLITITELIQSGGNVAAHTNLPVLADGDDGGGSPNNVYRATQDFERVGVAAIMYEDTVQVKHLARTGGELVTKGQMVDKIKAAVDARKDQNLVILARNDSLSEGYPMGEALERGVAYAEAGADVLFFSGMRLEDHAKARDVVRKPLMTSVGPTTTQSQAKAAKVGLLFYHVEAIGLGAIHQALKELKTTGNIANSSKMAAAPEVMAKLTGAQDYIERGRKYHLTK